MTGHAILSWNQIQEFFCVLVLLCLVMMIQKSATRQYFKPWYKLKFLKYFFSYDGENYVEIDESKYSHKDTYGLGNLEGRAVTTGCVIPSECYVKTEILDMTTMTWSDADDYPYGR